MPRHFGAQSALPRHVPAQATSNLSAGAQVVRSAIGTGDVKSALTAIAQFFDQAQTAIETVEGKLRDLGQPDARDPRSPSTSYVSGDRITGGVQVQGFLPSVAGQGIDLTFQNGRAKITTVDHNTGSILPADIIIGLSAFANNAAAIAGGLKVDQLYRTGGDPDLVAIVH